MKLLTRITFPIIFILCSCIFIAQVSSYSETFINADNIDFQILEYFPTNSEFKLDVQISNTAKDFDEYMSSGNAFSGINGIFFCPKDYSQCGGEDYTINERFVNGQDYSYYSDTGERGVFAWDEEYNTFLFKTGFINADKRSEIYSGMGNFPILLSSGKDQISYYDAIGILDHKMTSSLPRHFICAPEDNSKIMIGRSSAASLQELSLALQKIGCYNALNLDAGLSAQYIINGQKIDTGPRDVLDGYFIGSDSIDVNLINGEVDNIMGNIKKLTAVYKLQKNKLQILNLIESSLTKTIKQKRDSVKVEISQENYSGYTLNYQYNTKLVAELYKLNTLREKLKIYKKDLSYTFELHE